jgi:hypothetical protein
VAAGDRLLFPGGVTVPQSRMMGDISTTPTDPTPRFFDNGGNINCTEVKPGNTLYLPVFHEGGLLVLGDVHAAQGDGEAFGEAYDWVPRTTPRCLRGGCLRHCSHHRLRQDGRLPGEPRDGGAPDPGCLQRAERPVHAARVAGSKASKRPERGALPRESRRLEPIRILDT